MTEAGCGCLFEAFVHFCAMHKEAELLKAVRFVAINDQRGVICEFKINAGKKPLDASPETRTKKTIAASRTLRNIA